MGLALKSQDIKTSTFFAPASSGATRGQGLQGFSCKHLDVAGEEEGREEGRTHPSLLTSGAGAARKQTTNVVELIIKFGNAAHVFCPGAE